MVPVPPHMLHMLVSAPVPYHNYMPAPPAYPAGSTQRATKEARASLEKKRLRNRVNQAKLRVREKKQNSTDREELTYLRKYVKDLDVQLEEAKNKMLKYESETPEPPRKRIIRTTSIETTSDAGSSGCPNSVAVSGSEVN